MRRFLVFSLMIVTLALAACATPTTTTTAPAPAEAATEAPAAAEAATEAPAEEPATAAVTETVATTDTTSAAAPSESTALADVDPMAVEGDIITAGSSTVYPLSEAVAEQFIDEGYAGNLTIDSIGSGAGFERFCVAGESDIANASRAINEEETASCAALGREVLEFRVGTDALAVVVNPENTWATDVTIEQLAQIFSAETTNWSDVDPSWPAEPIERFSPGTDSGTFDYFVEAVMDVAFPDAGEEELLRAGNLQLSEDDNVLVQGVEGNVNAIGYFGYAYYEENADRLGILSVNGVEPSAASVNEGTYPLARPLFIYSAVNIINEKPQIADFINYYLANVDDVIARVGYFPAPAEAIAAAQQTLADALQ